MKSKLELHVEDLSWKVENEKLILDEITMTFLKGGFYGILGPNGSGKTSLMRHLLRLIEAKSGRISLNDKKLNTYKRKELAQNIALVPQNTNIDTNFTAYDIVMMGRAPYQKRFEESNSNDQRIVKEAMEMTNCYHLKDEIYSNLSGGEAQRVITARAIAQQTPWLVLDEPISHLDIRYQIELMEHLKQLNAERGVSVLAVLHDINIAASYCKQIVLMKNSKIVAYGPTEEILTKENLEEVFEMRFMGIEQPGLQKTLFFADIHNKN